MLTGSTPTSTRAIISRVWGSMTSTVSAGVLVTKTRLLLMAIGEAWGLTKLGGRFESVQIVSGSSLIGTQLAADFQQRQLPTRASREERSQRPSEGCLLLSLLESASNHGLNILVPRSCINQAMISPQVSMLSCQTTKLRHCLSIRKSLPCLGQRRKCSCFESGVRRWCPETIRSQNKT